MPHPLRAASYCGRQPIMTQCCPRARQVIDQAGKSGLDGGPSPPANPKILGVAAPSTQSDSRRPDRNGHERAVVPCLWCDGSARYATRCHVANSTRRPRCHRSAENSLPFRAPWRWLGRRASESTIALSGECRNLRRARLLDHLVGAGLGRALRQRTCGELADRPRSRRNDPRSLDQTRRPSDVVTSAGCPSSSFRNDRFGSITSVQRGVAQNAGAVYANVGALSRRFVNRARTHRFAGRSRRV